MRVVSILTPMIVSLMAISTQSWDWNPNPVWTWEPQPPTAPANLEDKSKCTVGDYESACWPWELPGCCCQGTGKPIQPASRRSEDCGVDKTVQTGPGPTPAPIVSTPAPIVSTARPEPEPEPEPEPTTVATCFPGSSQVKLTTGESLSMDELKTGDSIMTIVNGKMTATTVLGFLFKKYGNGNYLTIHTEDGYKVSLSGTHVMFVNNYKDVMAEDVNIGDLVIVQYGDYVNKSRVVKIEAEEQEGAYVPLTEHGNLLVDGVLCSCYANGPDVVAHVLMTPARWIPSLFLDDREGERVIATAAKHFAYYLHKLGLLNYYHSIALQKDVVTKSDLNTLEKKTLEEVVDTCPMDGKKEMHNFCTNSFLEQKTLN